MLHGSEYTDYFTIQPDLIGFGVESGKPVFGLGLVYGLLFSVVVDESNQSESCDPELIVRIGEKNVVLNAMWGNLAVLEKITGFVKNI